MDIVLLHDLKRIAEMSQALMKACDKLYADMEERSGGVPQDGRVSIMDIEKGGLDGKSIGDIG